MYRSHPLGRSIPAWLLLLGLTTPVLVAEPTRLANLPQSLKFAVIGDNGTGRQPQYDIGRQMTEARRRFAFTFALMLGDNLYGGQDPEDYVRKFTQPYQALLDADVVFHATLGNHDVPESRSYRPFNMNGERYYTFVRDNVRFFALDTNLLDAKQLAWFDAALGAAREEWKICFFHHPLYSNAGRHGSALDIRVLLEPLLVTHDVDVVFSGHDHIYERLKPQKGIHYFVVGSSGQLRRGDLQTSPTTAVGFDRDQAFMLVEIAGADMSFETISRTGSVVDSGVISRRAALRDTSNAKR